MSELGSGSGSSYPGALDTDNTLEVNSPNVGKTKARAEVPNDLAAAVVAIETELGIDPAGSLTDVKTFLQTQHGTDGTHGAVTATSVSATSVSTDTITEKTAAAGVTVDGLLIKDGYAAGANAVYDGTNIIKTKIIDIGDWNMDVDLITQVNHGLTLAKIRNVRAMIRNDAADTVFEATPGLVTGPAEVELFIQYITSTIVRLTRRDAGVFDSVNFDSTAYNRGWITIVYVV